MKKFIQKTLLFSVLPLLLAVLMVILYVNTDPYEDFGKKQNYSWKYFFQQLGDLSTKKLLNSTQKYNSFVFGSSRSTSTYACYLNKSIPNASFFHYGNWNETIGGIYSKLKLIDSLGYPIDNVFLYIDTDFTFKGKGKSLPFDHHLITGKNEVRYLISHFNSYYKNLTIDKIKILLGCSVKGKIFPNWDSDLVTNDPRHHCDNPNVILEYPKSSNDDKFRGKIESLMESGFLYKRSLSQQYKEKSQISDFEKSVLRGIKDIFDRHSTNYYVVLSPLYDQNKFNKADQVILKETFEDRLFDFSGINEYTNNEYNYPDRKHFQPYIAKCIIDSVVRQEYTTNFIKYQ